MANQEQLEFQSNLIETVLAAHDLPSEVKGGTVTPRWIRFQVLPQIGVNLNKIKSLSEELAMALAASNCRIARRGATVDVEVPRTDPMPVSLLPLYRQLTSLDPSIPPVTGLLGLAEDGTPLLIRFPSPDVAHILIAGTGGAGKTALMRTLILSLAMGNLAPSPFSPSQESLATPAKPLRMVLIDPKRTAFGVFGDLPHVSNRMVHDIDHATKMLQHLAHMVARQADRNTAAELAREPYTVVFIDEMEDILQAGGHDAQTAITRLTQRGRQVGVHVVAATEKLSPEILALLSKASFPTRLVGRVASVSDARIATGRSGTGAERLMGRGDFLAVAEGRVVRLQAAFVSPDEIRETVTQLSQNEMVTVGEAWKQPLTRLTTIFTSESP